jgi:hypothetical protein
VGQGGVDLQQALRSNALGLTFREYLSFFKMEKIGNLNLAIQREFSREMDFPANVGIAYAIGDHWAVQNIESILNYRNWTDISFEDFSNCGTDELKSYLSPQALLYYLPGLLACCAKELEVGLFHRLHEISVLMLLPTTPEYQDVWDYFGDGLFDGSGTSEFMNSTENLIKKIEYVRASLTPGQSACVACYIEIIESHGVVSPDAEFLNLLKKFTDFWKR